MYHVTGIISSSPWSPSNDDGTFRVKMHLQQAAALLPEEESKRLGSVKNVRRVFLHYFLANKWCGLSVVEQ